MRPIVLGQKLGDDLVIDQGVKAGESVIVTGQLMVMPGAPVMVVPSGPPPAAPSAGAPTTNPTTKPADAK
jgi:hypothetical protein